MAALRDEALEGADVPLDARDLAVVHRLDGGRQLAHERARVLDRRALPRHDLHRERERGGAAEARADPVEVAHRGRALGEQGLEVGVDLELQHQGQRAEREAERDQHEGPRAGRLRAGEA